MFWLFPLLQRSLSVFPFSRPSGSLCGISFSAFESAPRILCASVASLTSFSGVCSSARGFFSKQIILQICNI